MGVAVESAVAGFVPTPEQREILAAVAQPRGSVMVEAGAGCAKTTTITLAAARAPKVPSLALAFNKRIAEDMAAKLPASFTVKTMNGLGHGAWGRVLPTGTRVNLDAKKLGRLVTQVDRDFKAELTSDQWSGLRQLVGFAMTMGLVPKEDPFGEASLVPDDWDGWETVGAEAGLDRAETQYLWELGRTVLIRSIAEARAGTISFDDQVYCSTMLGGRFPQFPQVFVDEDQDLNPLNHRMLGQVVRAGGRLVAVGDKRQAIYGWRGASGDSAERIRALMPEWTELPLMTTFRCPRAVVARQQSHVPGFRAGPGNPEGVVDRFRDPTGHGGAGAARWEGWGWEDLKAARPGGTTGITVLCRNNAPLLSLAFKLIRGGVGVTMLGRDIGKGLVSLSRKLAAGDEVPADTLRGKIRDWMDGETALAQANGHEERLDAIRDKGECLLAVLDSTECRDARGLRQMLDRLFAAEVGIVTLSSIHKAKGLEWDYVVLLDPWRIPSRQAKAAAAAGNPGPLEQEYNLRYVAETRTRHTLVLADLEDFRA